MQINEEFSEAECELAIELANLNQLEESREHFLNALEINPNFAKAYFHYGLLLIKVNDIEEAKNNFDKVTEIDQNYSPAYFYKAFLLKMQMILMRLVKIMKLQLT